MIVQCDKCERQFDVPESALLPNGRQLKCAGCGHTFFQDVPNTEEPSDDIQETHDQDTDDALSELDNELLSLADDLLGDHNDLPDGDDETPGGDDETPGGDDETPGGDENTPGGEKSAALSQKETTLLDDDPLDDDPLDDDLLDDDLLDDDLLDEDPLDEDPLDDDLLDDDLLDDDLLDDDPLDEDSDGDAARDWVTSSDELKEIEIDGDPELDELAGHDVAFEEVEEEPLATREAHQESEEKTTQDPEDWATPSDALKEIDVDVDPELRALHAADTLADMEEDDPWLDEHEDPWPDEEKTETTTEHDVGPLLSSRPTTVASDTDPPKQEEKPADDHKAEPVSDGPLDDRPDDPLDAQLPVREEKPSEEKRTVDETAEDDQPAEIAQPDEEGQPQNSAKKVWALMGLLLVGLVAVVMPRMAWWSSSVPDDASSVSLKQPPVQINPYQLLPVRAYWQEHAFGTLLLVQGNIAHNGDDVATPPPLARISLLSKEREIIRSMTVVPGRVVDKDILKNVSKAAIQEMIALQSQERTKADLAWSTTKTVPFQVIFINPPEAAVYFQVAFK